MRKLILPHKFRLLATAVALFTLATLAGVPSAIAKPQKNAVVLLDTFVNNQAITCYERPIEGGTTNGYEKQAASFSVAQPANVSKIVLPVVVGPLVVGAPPVPPGTIQVAVVAGKPFDGGTSFWNNIPDESARIGRPATAVVTTQWTPCGAYEVVTATFKTPVHVVPGSVYWVVLQNPRRGMNTFSWKTDVNYPDTSSTNAQYVVDSNGSRWVSYAPGTFPNSAMRVLGSFR